MSATIASLVSQSGDIDFLNDLFHTAEALLEEAPVDICIPARCWENLCALFERRYQQTKDPDDLQAAITWAGRTGSGYNPAKFCPSSLSEQLYGLVGVQV